MQGIDVIFSIGVLLFSAIVHEVSHGYMALYLGDPTARLAGRLTLNPTKHLDPFGSVILPALLALSHLPVFGWAKPVPYNPYNLRKGKWGPALVAFAGPGSNIGIAILFSLLVRLGSNFMVLPITVIQIVSIVVIVNIYLALFNIVPIPPLDGSKVLFALLPYRYAHLQAFLERYGFFILLLFIFVFGGVLEPLARGLFRVLTGF